MKKKRIKRVGNGGEIISKNKKSFKKQRKR